MTTNVVIMTDICRKRGFVPDGQFQVIGGFAIYPTEVFCPRNMTTGVISPTEKTVTIHHFAGSWVPEDDKFRWSLRTKLCKVLPQKLVSHIARLVTLVKFEGIISTFRFISAWLKETDKKVPK